VAAPLDGLFRLALGEASLLTLWALVVALWLFDVRGSLAADSWLSLLGGREILEHGIPHHDALAVLSHDRAWVDQQWLAQLGLYGVYELGGFGLLVRANVLVCAIAFGLALVASRRRGASPSRVLLCTLPAALLTVSFVRTEMFSRLLFVVLLILLIGESRRRSWRVLLAFPLLALWANVHGAVVVGAALVALLGLTELWTALRSHSTRAAARASVLVVAPWACLFASPYGFGVLDYYRATLGNPVFAQYLTEWKPPTFASVWGVIFFVPAVLTIFLVGRRPRDLNPFELGALTLTFVAGLLAVRSVVWFAYAMLILVPALLESVWPADRLRGVRPSFAAALTTFAVGFAAFVLVSPGNAEARWPAAAGDVVAKAAEARPSARVFTSEKYADWLVFEHPALRGRIAFDGRWEIVPPRRMGAIVGFLYGGTISSTAPGRYSLLVLDLETNGDAIRTIQSERRVRTLYRDGRVVVFERLAPS
jgi:hypothetical protein